MFSKKKLVIVVSVLLLAFIGCDDGILSSGGSINVSSDPRGAEIYLDGNSTGESTNTILTKISAGSHTIKLTLSGYEDIEKTVEVADNDTAYVGIPMTEDADDPGPVSVDVTGNIVLGDWFVYYKYTFNQDVTLTNGEISMPGQPTYTIDYVYGSREANRTYGVVPFGLEVDPYTYQPMIQVPRGTHVFQFEGITADGENFTLSEEIPLD